MCREVELLHVSHESSVSAIATAEGPARLLEAGLAERLTEAGARVRVTAVPGPGGERNPVAEAFEAADAVARAVRAALGRGRTAVVLSGSCQMGLGAASGLPAGRRGVVWLDAHGDFNTPDTTGSGLVDGTVLATLTGRCWGRLAAGVDGFAPVPDRDVLLVGARALDPGEEGLLEASSVRRLPVADVREGLADGALESFAEGLESVYVHLDLDVLDPSDGRANAYAAPGGLSRAELVELLGAVGEECPVRAFGLASYDPAADEGGAVCAAALEAAAAILASEPPTSGPERSGSPHGRHP